MTTEKIKTVSGDELLNMDLPPLKYAVHDFLPQGLHILAGPPKVGKSWLLLQLCLKVARGDPLWNYTTEKGTVLYLSLEDSHNRIQQRLGSLTEDAPPNLRFAIMANSLTDGLTEQIEMFIKDYPDTNLIVIDTLQKVRDGTGENLYAGDYKDISTLKTIADQNAITILCVQHLRKLHDNDPHMMVSGSTGLTGAADGTYVLQRTDTTSTEAKLYIRGRDIEERVLILRSDTDTCQWDFISGDTPAADKLKNDSVMQTLIAYARREKEFCGQATELVALLDLKITGNSLSRKLTTYERELDRLGITVTRTRTGQRRELKITYASSDAS